MQDRGTLEQIIGTPIEDAVMDLLVIYELSLECPLVNSVLDGVLNDLRSLKSWARAAAAAYKKHSAQTLTGGRYG